MAGALWGDAVGVGDRLGLSPDEAWLGRGVRDRQRRSGVVIRRAREIAVAMALLLSPQRSHVRASSTGKLLD